MAAGSEIVSVSDLEPYLSGNATLSSIQQNVGLLEKLVFGLILADVILFLLLLVAICMACKPCRQYKREAVPYTSVDINVPQKAPISDPGRCGLQA
jgi:hypothetical protein